MAARKKPGRNTTETKDYRHEGVKRKNLPPAKIAAEGKVPKVEKARYWYSPHLPPVLRFDPDGDADRPLDLLEEVRRRPLTEEETALLAGALRVHEPWLEHLGLIERTPEGRVATQKARELYGELAVR